MADTKEDGLSIYLPLSNLRTVLKIWKNTVDQNCLHVCIIEVPIVLILIIIPQAQMGSESITHSAFSLMGY